MELLTGFSIGLVATNARQLVPTFAVGQLSRGTSWQVCPTFALSQLSKGTSGAVMNYFGAALSGYDKFGTAQPLHEAIKTHIQRYRNKEN